MKWGRRKVSKWATSKHQPSSVKSSTLAGLYAATGNRKIGKALDKSNSKDAENWERAKKEYKKLAFTQTSGYRNMMKKVIANKTINKAATKIYNYNMRKAKRKAEIKKIKDPDVRFGMKYTGASRAEVEKGIEAANQLLMKQGKLKIRDL